MISIIVPFYDGKRYLSKCLKNLSKIKYEDFEIILIDDFSEDNSEEIVEKWLFEQKEKITQKIKYYYTKERTIGPRKCKKSRNTKIKWKIYNVFRCR